MTKSACVVASLAILSFMQSAAWAEDAAPASQPVETPVTETAPAPAAVPATVLGERQLPKIVVRWECGNCTVNEKVAPLLETAWAAGAAENGFTVSEAESADVVITSYRQRPPGLRVMFGVFAGKDQLGVRVSYRGKDFSVEDYYANAMRGMNGLCDSVGKESAKKMITLLSGS